MNKCITCIHHSFPTPISCMVKHTNQENHSANCISLSVFHIPKFFCLSQTSDSRKVVWGIRKTAE